MSDDIESTDNGGDGDRSPTTVAFTMHPKEKFARLDSLTSLIGGVILLFCALFWYLESVSTNFVHQWALMLVNMVVGVTCTIILVFALAFHFSRTSSDENKLGLSPWHRWALWGNCLAIALYTTMSTLAIWMWIRENNIPFEKQRFNPTTAPASQPSVQYYPAASQAAATAGLLLFSTLYTAWRNAYPEAVDEVRREE